MKHPRLIALFCVLTGLAPVWSASAQEATPTAKTEPQPQSPTPEGCGKCHNGSADALRAGPPHQSLTQSVHADLDCTSCHESISMETLDPEAARPHGEAVPPVNCGECHEEETEAYQKHGRMDLGEDPDIPSCWSCHGAHDILPADNRYSHVHPGNLAQTCMNCHTDVDLVREHDILTEKPPLGENAVYFYMNILQGPDGSASAEAMALNREIGFEITRLEELMA